MHLVGYDLLEPLQSPDRRIARLDIECIWGGQAYWPVAVV